MRGRAPKSPHKVREGFFNALSLRYMSASEGGAERPKAASDCSFRAAFRRPAGGDMLSPFPSLTASSAGSLELPAEMDPGFPTQAGGRRAPVVVRYTGRSGFLR